MHFILFYLIFGIIVLTFLNTSYFDSESQNFSFCNVETAFRNVLIQ